MATLRKALKDVLARESIGNKKKLVKSWKNDLDTAEAKRQQAYMRPPTVFYNTDPILAKVDEINAANREVPLALNWGIVGQHKHMLAAHNNRKFRHLVVLCEGIIEFLNFMKKYDENNLVDYDDKISFIKKQIHQQLKEYADKGSDYGVGSGEESELYILTLNYRTFFFRIRTFFKTLLKENKLQNYDITVKTLLHEDTRTLKLGDLEEKLDNAMFRLYDIENKEQFNSGVQLTTPKYKATERAQIIKEIISGILNEEYPIFADNSVYILKCIDCLALHIEKTVITEKKEYIEKMKNIISNIVEYFLYLKGEMDILFEQYKTYNTKTQNVKIEDFDTLLLKMERKGIQFSTNLVSDFIIKHKEGGRRNPTKKPTKLNRGADMNMKDIRGLCKVNQIKLSKTKDGVCVIYTKKELITKLRRKKIL